ncbi:MAG: GEVED domain-containing protein [Holophagales bacterium]|nr:GEVED domain-containing protein [Holophagales bacterium]
MGPYLGTCVDADDGTQQNVASTSDDLSGASGPTFGTCSGGGDDEDGAVFSATLLSIGGSFDLTLDSSSAVGCRVNGFVDWNRNGDFGDAGEQILTDVVVASGSVPFAAIPVPANAVPGFTYARFRCSSAGGDGPDGPAADGEVEDYRLEVIGADWGDAPDVPYGTIGVSGGAVHATDPNVEMYLGNCVDTESDGQPTAGADGDDTMLGDSRIGDCIDDEDGVAFGGMLVRGMTVPIAITASMPGRIDAWIDFDGVGGFTVGDQVLADAAVVAGINNFMIPVPALAAPGPTYARFRYSSAGGLAPTGMAADGEVEDYRVLIKAFDFGDAPEPAYPTLLASGGARHVVDPTGNLYLGPAVNGCADVEDDGVPGPSADGDDTTATLNAAADSGLCAGADDEDGITFDTMIIACQQAQITVTARAAGRLDAWIDYDRTNANGFGGAADQIFANTAISAGTNVLTFDVPCTTELGDSYARFRFSSAGGLSPAGPAMDGEVEDYPIFIKGVDFGDAADSHDTTFGAGGPHHGVDPIAVAPLYLGACVDTETDASAPLDTTGDDGAAGTGTVGTCAVAGDDEDGVAFTTMVVGCGSASVDITASAAGVLDAWIDFDGDGDFAAAADRIFTGVAVGAGTSSQSFSVPCQVAPGPVSTRFRLSSTGVAGPTGPAMDGEVEDYEILLKGVDFGDAPDTYSTLFASTGPFHDVDPALGLFLGSCVDTEVDGQPSAAATGDDAALGTSVTGSCAGNDDEDGVSFDTRITACKTGRITVTASAAGLLDAWLDFDGDGDFTAGGDQIFTSEPLAAGPNVLTFPVPCTATDGTTYARFRLSSAGGLSFDGPATDGEVEDYQIRSDEADLGDAPDSYSTLFGSGGALHGVDPLAGLYLGACVDTEVDGQPSVGADGDDATAGSTTLGTCVANDDEDGVTFDTMVIACQLADLTVTASAAGLLDAWIDFDGDGTFVGPSDQIFASQLLAMGANSLSFQVPCGAAPGATYARFRFSSTGGLSFGGTTPDGEVEDYALSVKGADLGDAPDTYATTFGASGPNHGIDPATVLYLGACVDTDADGQPAVGADGDDLAVGISTVGTCAADDDEDGVTFDSLINVCLTADITVTAASSGVLNAWLDLDGDGTFNGPADQIFTDQALVAGANSLSFPVPCDAIPGDSYARFRFDSLGGLGFDGPAMDGEVEDYAVLVSGFDYGDSPDPSYPTLLASDGARHIVRVSNNPTLGSLVDIEPEGLQSTDHLGDDGDGLDDEDGVVFLESELIPGTVTQIEVSAGATGGNLSAWIDWNLDGDWDDAGEQIATDLPIAAGVTETLDLPVPVPALQGPSCARFRFSSATGLAPTGRADDGEVEDYAVPIGAEMPRIGLSKTLISLDRVDMNEYSVVLQMGVDNLGNVPLSSVQVTAELAEAFADAEGFTVDSVDSDELTVNPLFDGESDVLLLTGTDILGVGESGSIVLILTLYPGKEAGPYICSSTATGDSPADMEVSDISQDGDDSDPDGDGDATDNDEPTVIYIELFPLDIPTVGQWGLMVLFFLLLLAGAAQVRNLGRI